MPLLPMLLALVAHGQDATTDLWRPAIDSQHLFTTESSRMQASGTTEWSTFASVVGGFDGSSAARLDAVGGVFLGPVRLGAVVPLEVVNPPGQAGPIPGLGHAALDIKGALIRPGAGNVGMALGSRILLPTSTLGLGRPGLGAEGYLVTDADLGAVQLATNLGVLTASSPTDGVDGSTWAVTARAGLALPATETSGFLLDGAVDVPLAGQELPPSEATPWRWRATSEGRLGGWLDVAESVRLRAAIGLGYDPRAEDALVRGVIGASWQPSGEERRIIEPADIARVPVSFHLTGPSGEIEPDRLVIVGPTDKTLLDGTEITFLPGTYYVAAHAPGHRMAVERFTVPAERETRVDLDLAPMDRPAQVRITAADPSGRPLEGYWAIDFGEPRALGSDETVEVEPGVHTVVIQPRNMAPIERSITIEPGDRHVLELVLDRRELAAAEALGALGERVYFRTDVAQLQEGAEESLREIRDVLLDNDWIGVLRIVGHADERGPDTYNLQLARERAQSVRDWLVTEGVDPERLEVVSAGERDPADPVGGRNAWARNRRVEMVIAETAIEPLPEALTGGPGTQGGGS